MYTGNVHLSSLFCLSVPLTFHWLSHPYSVFCEIFNNTVIVGGLILLGELKYLERNLFSGTWTYLGLNLIPHDERPTTNSLSHGVTSDLFSIQLCAGEVLQLVT